MGLNKKTCYTIVCDNENCISLCKCLEDYIGPLDGLTTSPSIAENFARDNGFVKISARRWLCPSCVEKFNKGDKH